MHKKHLPSVVSHTALVSVLAFVAFANVIPYMKSMKALPHSYYVQMPVARTADFDRDMITNVMDGSPMSNLHAAASEDKEEVIE